MTTRDVMKRRWVSLLAVRKALVWGAMAGGLLTGCSTHHRDDQSARQDVTVVRAAITETKTLSLSLPPSVAVNDVMLGASQSVRLADRTRIVPGTFAALTTSTGAIESDIGADTQVRSIVSVGNVLLRDRARVDGNVQSQGVITARNGVVVTGVRSENVNLSPPVVIARPLTFVGGANVNREPDQPAAVLAPGNYGNVNIKSRSGLTLSSGTYFFDSVTMESQARLQINATPGQPLIVYVRDVFNFKGDFVHAGDPADVFFGIFHTGTSSLERSLDGTVVVPVGTLRLAPANRTFRGSLFARSIEAEPDLTLTHVPFAHWGSVLVPSPTLLCVQNNGSTRQAIFGYQNSTGNTLTVPAGALNRFEPAIAGTNPITTFQPGVVQRAMVVQMPGPTLTWVLGANQVAAGASSPVCGLDGEGASAPAPDAVARLNPNVISQGMTAISADQPFRGRPVSTGTTVVSGGGGSSSGGSGIGVIQQPLAAGAEGRFRFRITSIHVPDGDTGSEQEPYVSQLSINNVGQGGLPDDLPDCEEDTTCNTNNVYDRNVPINQATVGINLTIMETDDVFDDDLELFISVVFDNLTGAVVDGLASSPDPEEVNRISPGETCAGAGGWTICWQVEPANRPRICTSFKAQYLDGGPAPGGTESRTEAYLATRAQQEVPASFAGYILEVSDPSGMRFSSSTQLDAEGCVPFELSPSTAQLMTGDPAGALTVTLKLASLVCLDPAGNGCRCTDAAGNRCAKDTGAEFWVRDPATAGDLVAHMFCSELSENSGRVVPSCNTNSPAAGGTTMANWSGRFPPARIDLLHPDNNDVTRVAGVTSFLARREAAMIEAGIPGGLGILYAVADKSFSNSASDPSSGHDRPGALAEQVVRIDVNTICASVNDSCAGDPISLKGNSPLTDPAGTCALGTADCLPADSFYKFVAVHEIGHVIQRRAFGDIAGDLSAGVSNVDLCKCDHINTSNRLHCLQSVEGTGAGQREGWGQFFAAAAFNDPGPSCRFNYYKEFIAADCIPGHEPVGGCMAVNGRQVTLPPVPVSCVDQVRWRNNNCTSDLSNADNTTEFDWMGFYRNLVYGSATPVLSFQELSEVYQRACGAEGVPCDFATNPTVVFETADVAGEVALADVVGAKFGPTSPQAMSFKALGDVHGVSRVTSP